MPIKRVTNWLRDKAVTPSDSSGAGANATGPGGGIDIVSSLRIVGWVYPGDGMVRDSACLLVNDTLRLPLGNTVSRPDVMEAGHATHPDTGFELRFCDLDPDLFSQLDDLFVDGKAELSLLAGDNVLVHRSFEVGREFASSLGSPGPGLVDGWVTAPAPPEPVSAEISADGYFIERLRLVDADPERAAREGAGWGCAVRTRLACSVSGNRVSQLKLGLSGRIGQSPARIEIETPARAECSAKLASALSATDDDAPVSVILLPDPDRKGFGARLDAIARNTTRPVKLVMLDTGEGHASAPASWQGKLTTIHASRPGEPLADLANRAYRLSGKGDVVILGPGLVPGPRWLENLQLAAYSSPDTGMASPLTGRFPPPEGWSQDDIARQGLQSAGTLWPVLPQRTTPCLYIRRACLDDVGGFKGADMLSEPGRMAGLKGWQHVLDDRTVMAGPDFAGTRAPGERLARARLLHALKRRSDPPRPRILFVISLTEGGTARTHADLVASLADRYECLVLESDGRQMTLKRLAAQHVEIMETCRLAEPVEPVTHRSAEYDRLAAEWMVAHGVELVHIRHLAWHGLGLLNMARRLAIPVIHSFHDYYTACPTVKLLDGDDRYCAGRCTEPTGRDCVPDLWVGVTTPPLKNAWVHDWRAGFDLALSSCDAFVTTSHAAKAILTGLMPGLAAGRFHVIAHGRDLEPAAPRRMPAPASGEPLRVLLAGHITPAKGADLIRAIKALDSENLIEFHILGTCDYPLEPGDAIIHGAYAREDFAALAAGINPHIGAALSIWPETYLHTLTEMWSVGLAILALDLGAMGERVGKEGPGWLVKPDPEDLPERLFRRLIAIRSQGSWNSLAGKAYRQARSHEASLAGMADRYDALYRDVLKARRTLRRHGAQ